MMDNGTSKRLRTSSSNADALVICTNCGQLSADICNCEHCGCPLSAMCNDINSKRPCVSAVANGVSTSHTMASGDMVIPIPQSLYLNKNVTVVNTSSPPVVVPVSSRGDVRPQALYVNVNNQSHVTSAPPPSTAVSVTLSSRPPLPTAPPGLGTPYPVGNGGQMHVVPSRGPASNDTQPQLYGQPTIDFGKSSLTAKGPYKKMPPSYSSATAQVLTMGSTVVPVTGAPAAKVSAPSNSVMPSTTPVAEPSAQPAEVSINAFQIRIGTHKFLPLSPVTFKDDGILFTLRGYTHAPVLLNARAIMICKANLMFEHYPVLFLYLESSCMRQIRTIFSLTEDEFSDNSKYTLKRCITIFPNASSNMDTRSISQSIIAIFTSMARKYPSVSRKFPLSKDPSRDSQHYSKILYLMSPDVAIDTLLAMPARDETLDAVIGPATAMTEPTLTGSSVSAAAVVGSTAGSAAPASNFVSSPMVGSALMSASMPRMPLRQQAPTQISHASTPTVSLNSHAMIQNSALTNIPSQTGNSHASPPILKVPTDRAQWQQMQKNLVIGGVYHVQTANGLREYCLWNGTQLVPCLVQNTEVQVDCTLVRVGASSFSCVGQVRIKANSPSGIYFSIKRPQCSKHDAYLSHYDLIKCMIYLQGSMSLMYLYITSGAATKMKTKCNLVNHSDQYRHIVLFLKQPNTDQKDALLQMKFSTGRAKPIFESVSITQALNLLQKVDSHTKEGSLAGNNNVSNDQLTGSLSVKEHNLQMILERMKNELTTPAPPASSSSSSLAPAADDDDDDDVIMTSEEVGMKCPYTQQTMKEPMRNKICGHNYERSAIIEFIIRKKGIAKCPYAGCGNQTPLQMDDLELNADLKTHIEKEQSKSDHT